MLRFIIFGLQDLFYSSAMKLLLWFLSLECRFCSMVCGTVLTRSFNLGVFKNLLGVFKDLALL